MLFGYVCLGLTHIADSWGGGIPCFCCYMLYIVMYGLVITWII